MPYLHQPRAFDRRATIGLHHLSLAVADDDALEAGVGIVGTKVQ